MKEHRGSSDAKTAIVLVLFVAVTALAPAACGGSSKSGSTASSTTPSITASPTTTPPAASDPAQVARTESVVKAITATWNNAWSANRDRDGLSSFYADDVMYYDATIDGVITKSDMDAMGQDPTWWKSFQLKLKSSFVSPDGRFAATLGMIALRNDAGKLPWQPAASVMTIANGKVVWEYDYYGGEPGKSGQTEPMLTLPRGAAAPKTAGAQARIAGASATIKRWVAAFNDRDVATFLSCYADNASYVDVVSPRWRVMNKDRLAANVTSLFPMSEFSSRLQPEPGSPMDSGFFVSADGRFAAVQGTYIDAQTQEPMLVILELKAGEIVRQYNYIAVNRSLLRP
jgi:ketosteroid isomerase-like protein